MTKIEKYKKLLVVVDMVNGFIKEGKMSDRDINHITPKIESLVRRFLSEDEAVAFIKDTHTKDSVEFKKYPEHCIGGTSECELISELSSYEKDSLTYKKNSTSTIFASNFMRDIERMKSLEEVIITGCCTDICIMNLAIPLVNYFDEHDRDVMVRVPQNAVETFNSETHDRCEYNKMALKLMRNQGIGVENI